MYPFFRSIHRTPADPSSRSAPASGDHQLQPALSPLCVRPVSALHPPHVRFVSALYPLYVRPMSALRPPHVCAARLQAETTNYKGAASVLAKWLWLAAEEPAALAAASTMLLGAHSYVVVALGGAAACDRTTASTTGAPSVRPLSALCPPYIRALSAGQHCPRRAGLLVRSANIQRTYSGHRADTERTQSGHRADTERTQIGYHETVLYCTGWCGIVRECAGGNVRSVREG